jgi:hypothetical protein
LNFGGNASWRAAIRNNEMKWEDNKVEFTKVDCENGRCMELAQGHVESGIFCYQCRSIDFYYNAINLIITAHFLIL